jgi:hypothetical protein
MLAVYPLVRRFIKDYNSLIVSGLGIIRAVCSRGGLKMSRQYRQHFTQCNHITMRFRMGDPYGNQRRVEADMKRQFDEQAAKNANLPEKSAEEIRNDRQVFIGLINGVLIGGVLAGVGGYLAGWNVITICFAVFGGVVVGGLIGAMITRLVLWMNGRKEKPEKQDKNNQTHI